MIEEFLTELNEALTAEGVKSKDAVIADYRKQYYTLLKSGKSEFEIVVFFGEPKEIAAKLKHPNKKISAEQQLLSNPLLQSITENQKEPKEITEDEQKEQPKKEESAKKEEWLFSGLGPIPFSENKTYTKSKVILSDIFYYGLLSAIELFGLVLLFGLTALSFGASCVWLVKSFTEFSTAAGKTGAFFMTLFVLALCALFVYVGIRLIKVFISFSKDYFVERGKKMNSINQDKQ